MTGTAHLIGTHVTQIIECTRCQAPQVFGDDKYIPEALEVNLNGGYGMFIDNWQQSDEYNLMLCHKCAHEFVNWLGLPQIGHMGHPKTQDEYCNGWVFTEEEQKQELAMLINLAERRKNGK